MALNVYCIEKIRNSAGSIVEYVMSDESGNVCNFKRKGMLDLLNNRSYNVMNLQLSSDGRIVDKTMKNEQQTLSKINRRSESTDLEVIFERAYNMFQHKQMVVTVIQDNRIVLLDAPFNMLGSLTASNIDQFLNHFELYMMNKYHYTPAKLEVVNTANNWKYIMYGDQYLECTLMHRKNYFPGISNIQCFRMSSNVDTNRYAIHKKVANIYDSNTGRVVENAFVGVIVYDKTHKEAAEWASKQIAELDKKAEALSKKVNRNTFGNTLLKWFRK
ncbi:MAG: hypothetical protein IKY94_05240 [Lachnospiraceae bacterium]|nr:hypothetical protein [Lachnospiraceae bacterium]